MSPKTPKRHVERTATTLFTLGGLLLLVGLTGGFQAAVLTVQPGTGARAIVATVLGVLFVLLAAVMDHDSS